MSIRTLANWLPTLRPVHRQANGTGAPARRSWPFALSYLAGALVAASLPSGTAAAQEIQLSPGAEAQIGAIMRDKAARTPAQQKLSSRLLYGAKRQRADALMQAVPALRSSVRVAGDGTTLVDIKAEVSDALLSEIAAVGGRVVNSFPRYGAIRAHVPMDRLEDLARASAVVSIRPADQAITNKIDTTEGDVAHRAVDARAVFGVDGSGIKICAISDGIDSLSGLQVSRDLPAVDVPPGQAGFGSEGTALLEIIHDLAPGAKLGFATAIGGQAQFAQNILDLRNVLGCDVIVDDVFYFAEPAFQDGIVAGAVEQVVADGAVYFSSAGNSGNLNDFESGVWEGDYNDSGVDITVRDPIAGTVISKGRLHGFGSATSNVITQSAPFAISLQWSEPQSRSVADYDLCVFDATLTNVRECSTNFQNGTQDPFEIIGPANAGERLIIINSSGFAPGRFLHLTTHRGRLSIGTDGQITGHSAAESAFSVAAVDVATAGGGAFVGGPANFVEFFSSDGPRRMFFESDGTPITSGNFSSTGGKVRQKPDIAAADGVSTATPGFNPFFGTSASAPHAAAIAGLMLAVEPNLTAADVRDVFNSTALDIEAPGLDRDSGAGIVDAFAALDHLAGRRLIMQRTIDGGWTKVRLRKRMRKSVIIAGPPTSSNKQPGVVALRKVKNRSFQARFQEWRYQDGKHPEEEVTFLIVKKGRTRDADGSIWEAGTVELKGNRKWKKIKFKSPFPGTPEVFLTLQTSDDKEPVTVRARSVTQNGFQAALLEEERDQRTGHSKEKVGYVAVYSPTSRGTAAGSVPYRLKRGQHKKSFKNLLNHKVKLEEEKSKDKETRHKKESVSAMTLGVNLFAQQVTDNERDTTALRRK